MDHYFIEKDHVDEDYFEISQKFLNEVFYFKSCDDIFSKNEVDYGSFVLINTILKKQKLVGNVLDVGCGYGSIGIVLAKYNSDAVISFSDINGTAVELTKYNIKRNNVSNIGFVVKSNAFDDIKVQFDYIISNPPIKAGKKVLLSILDGAYDHLNKSGKFYLVIKKKFGEDSVKKYLAGKFNNVEVINRDNGYYILEASK